MAFATQIQSENGLCVEVLKPRAGQLPPGYMDTITTGVASENMRGVTPQDILASYALYFARNTEGNELMGTVRQLPRTYLQTEFDDNRVCISELGTLWVDPQFRGRNVAENLVRVASNLMDVSSIVPVAVCNPAGRRIFEHERVGFVPVAAMPSGRVVEIFPPGLDWQRREMWDQGMQDSIVAQMAELPRFAGMQPFGRE